MDDKHKRGASGGAVIAVFVLIALLPGAGYAQSLRDVVISEIAWMGTTTSFNDE